VCIAIFNYCEDVIAYVISGFRSKVAEICSRLGYYASSSGNFLPTLRDNLLVPSSGFNNQDGTDGLSRNVGKKLPLLAA
jgi:hypothetical protein